MSTSSGSGGGTNDEYPRVVDLNVVRVVLGQDSPGRNCDLLPPEPNSSDRLVDGLRRVGIGMLAGAVMYAGLLAGGVAPVFAANGEPEVVASMVEPTSAVTVQDLQRYNGFEDFAAQGQQMENSDVGCFANECKRETASCFTDGSCLKV